MGRINSNGMNRSLLTLGLAVMACATVLPTSAQVQQRSATIVYIGGEKFYIHTVRQGDTLYSIARLYGVDEQTLVAYNPGVADAVKVDQNIKIPVVGVVASTATSEPLSAKEEKRLRKKFILYTIEAHDTLYSIAKRYGIAVETLLEDNEQLDPTSLTIGNTLLVRKTEVGKTTNAENLVALNDYKDRMNNLPDTRVRYYMVQPGDTIYSLIRANGITEEQLYALNSELSPATLRAGTLIKLPLEQGDTILPHNDEEDTSNKEARFPVVAPRETLKVSLLLPATTEGRANTNYAEFYQGFLLGIEQLRNEGRSIQLHVFDTAHNSAKVERIVADDALREAQLIVGPVYDDEFDAVLNYAEQATVPVVSPLATLDRESRVLFQMAPDSADKYRKLESLLHSGQHVVLVYGQKNDETFERAVKAMLTGVSYETLRYEKGSNVGSILTSHGDTQFVVLANAETEVDMILAALASANSNITSRGYSAPRYSVIGATNWNRFSNIDRNLFFKNRVSLVTNYHAKRDNEAVRVFDNRYIESFNSMPTLYSYRGYDAAYIFCSAMFNDINHALTNVDIKPLQTAYRFRRTSAGKYLNREWVLVSYNDNYTITID
jgi:LysM repeat protein